MPLSLQIGDSEFAVPLSSQLVHKVTEVHLLHEFALCKVQMLNVQTKKQTFLGLCPFTFSPALYLCTFTTMSS